MATYAARVMVGQMDEITHDFYRNWCRENCKKLNWAIGMHCIFFSDPQDALVFKLKFGIK